MKIFEVMSSPKRKMPHIKKVVKQLPDGSKITTYEVRNSNDVTVKTGMSREVAKDYLESHIFELY